MKVSPNLDIDRDETFGKEEKKIPYGQILKSNRPSLEGVTGSRGWNNIIRKKREINFVTFFDFFPPALVKRDEEKVKGTISKGKMIEFTTFQRKL